MNLRRLFPNMLFLLTLMATTACGTEPENQQELLTGRWELESASRNGSPTASLDDLFFEFHADGSMATNLPVAPGKSKYELEGNTLRQYGENMPGEVEYTIQELGDSSLILTAELRNFRFRFSMKKRPSKASQ